MMVAVVGVLTPACTPENQCQYQQADFCSPTPQPNDPTCTGHLIDATQWQSGPIDGTWADFTHNSTVTMHLRDAVTGAQLTGDIFTVECYTSPVANPFSPGQQFANGAGNLCEYITFAHEGSTPGWQVDVHNGTCADYFVYLAVTSTPSTSDAGTSGATDAAGD